jgi:hypothetical protein
VYRTSVGFEYAERCVAVVDDVEHLLLSVNDHVVRWQLDGLGGTEHVAAYAHCGGRHAAVNLLAPLILPATWARVSKQAIM